MSCNACTKRFGFFCKEYGCPNCGYSFCSKCLKKEIEVPRCNNVKTKVCVKCFEKLKKQKAIPKNQETFGSPTEIQINQVFTIDEPIEELAAPLKPINLIEKENADNELADNLDSVISKRLKELKINENIKNLDTDKDISERLADLKNVPYKDYSKDKSILLQGPSKTEQEQINELIKQFVEETSIDDEVEKSVNDPIADIERRLNILKGNTVIDNNEPKASNLQNEEQQAQKIIKKVVEEINLPGALEENEICEFKKDTEELPWCTICNEDAKLRCLDCDGELFCKQCFKECHNDEEYVEHRAESYKEKPNLNEAH